MTQPRHQHTRNEVLQQGSQLCNRVLDERTMTRVLSVRIETALWMSEADVHAEAAPLGVVCILQTEHGIIEGTVVGTAATNVKLVLDVGACLETYNILDLFLENRAPGRLGRYR
jgi:hypothetical protein